MNLALAILAYVIFAFFLGWGMLLAYHGSYALLITGVIVYTGMLYFIGCRNPQQQ